MVEHAAPGCDDQHDGGAEDGGDHAQRDAAHDDCVLGLFVCRGLHAHPRDRAGARTAGAVGDRPGGAGSKGSEMNWGSLSEFLAMGGYGLYVWGSYGVVLVLMVAEPLLARHRYRQALGQVGQSIEQGD